METSADSYKSTPETDEMNAFLDGIFAEDQSDPERSKAPECLRRLLEREKDFKDAPRILQNVYSNSVSLEAFHVAQNDGKNNDQSSALAHVQQALSWAQRVDPLLYGEESDWVAYVEATAAYFASNIAQMKVCAEKCRGSRTLVEGLLEGLQKRGRPNYRADYFGITD